MFWLGGWWQFGDWLQDWCVDYVVVLGQVVEWKLVDGFYLSLDVGSVVCVCIDGGQWWVELLCGVVVLWVKCDVLLFVVEVGEGWVWVLGIEFEVCCGVGVICVIVL